MTDAQLVSLISTGVVTGLLLFSGKIYQLVSDWWLKTILKKPTRKDREMDDLGQRLHKVISLTLEEIDLKRKYFSEIKQLVRRTVESIINEQRETFRLLEGTIPSVEFKESLHDYKCAGESLKSELIKLYMDAVEINGFLEKSVIEWSAYIDDLYESMVSKSNAWYDDWYIGTKIRLLDVRALLKNNKSDFMGLHSSLLNQIRQRVHLLEDAVSNVKAELEKTFSGLSDIR